MAFYHAAIRQRRNANYVTRIKNENGVWLENGAEIKDSVSSYFASLFGNDSTVQKIQKIPFQLLRIPEEIMKSIEELPTIEEVKEVVFSLSKDSVVGLNGVSTRFY